MKPIAEQCEELGWTVEELLGRTAREIRTLGFDIPANVPHDARLRPEIAAVTEIDTTNQGKRTGLIWTNV